MYTHSSNYLAVWAITGENKKTLIYSNENKMSVGNLIHKLLVVKASTLVAVSIAEELIAIPYPNK